VSVLLQLLHLQLLLLLMLRWQLDMLRVLRPLRVWLLRMLVLRDSLLPTAPVLPPTSPLC
jgi:hypothetical protein